MTFNPRITPARPDLAAKHLEGKILAAHYAEGVVHEVVEPQTPLRRAPSPDAPLDTEALYGERVTVYETTDEGWCWGQLASDGYVGWLSANALAQPGPIPTHKVVALRTFIFPAPSIKSPPIAALPFGACVAMARLTDPLAVTETGGYLPLRHLAALDGTEADVVAVAERFAGTPYLWGGKTSLGIDCSGLVQIALTAAGIKCPRDSDMQEAAVGTAIDPGRDFAKLKRGDLVFWKGHVAIARDATTLVHANAFHMAVVVEPVAEAIERISSAGSEVTSVRRPRQ